MGIVYDMNSLNKDKFIRLLTPIIFCVKEEQVTSMLGDYNSISINNVLSELLIKYKPDKRSLIIQDEFYKLVSSYPEPILLKDFEILFDPELQIDVLKLFILINRRKNISILWCGNYLHEKLIFSEEGYDDYKIYNINNYDISCII